MYNMRRLTIAFFGVTIVMILSNDQAFANGFKILGVKSTKATAMGEAFIVQADDPTAIAFNPAGLTQVEGSQFSAGFTITNGWVEHRSSQGVKEDILDKWQTIPYCFITTNLSNKGNITLGLGITAPNGLSTEWSQTGFARYVATFSELVVIDINPSIAYKIADNLSMGMGISCYYSTAVLGGIADYGNLVGLPGALDGEAKLEAKGYSWGYNFGVLYKLNERHSFAATFKSPFTIEYEGDSKYTNIPDFMGLGPSFDSDLETAIDFPAIVVLGYAYHPTDRLKLEFNLDWTNWETLDHVTVDFDSNLLSDFTYTYECENTFAYKFGLEYLVSEWFKLRAGYIYNENATPEEYWRPSLPDTDTHFACFGFGYKLRKVTLDGALQLIFFEDRSIDNNVDNNEVSTSSSIDGEYKNFGIAFSLGVTYKF